MESADHSHVRSPLIGTHYCMLFEPARFVGDKREHITTTSPAGYMSVLFMRVHATGYRIYERLEVTAVTDGGDLLIAYVPETPWLSEYGLTPRLPRPVLLMRGEPVHLSVRLIGELQPAEWWKRPLWAWRRWRASVEDAANPPVVRVSCEGIRSQEEAAA